MLCKLMWRLFICLKYILMHLTYALNACNTSDRQVVMCPVGDTKKLTLEQKVVN